MVLLSGSRYARQDPFGRFLEHSRLYLFRTTERFVLSLCVGQPSALRDDTVARMLFISHYRHGPSAFRSCMLGGPKTRRIGFPKRLAFCFLYAVSGPLPTVACSRSGEALSFTLRIRQRVSLRAVKLSTCSVAAVNLVRTHRNRWL